MIASAIALSFRVRPKSAVLVCFCIVFLSSFSQPASGNAIAFGNHAQDTSSTFRKVTSRNGQSAAVIASNLSSDPVEFGQTGNGGRVDLTGARSPAVLTSIAVTPATASVLAGAKQQFTATGTFSDGSTQDLTTTANWSSSNTSIANVGLHTGLAKGVFDGTASITATSANISGSATLAVTGTVLTSLAITPANATLASGGTQQFTATGTYSDGSTQNLTTTASWVSSATPVATIGLHTGLAKGVSSGTASISASVGSVRGTASLTVTATLSSIAVTPSTASLSVGNTQQFTATGTYSDGTTQTITTAVTWTSTDNSVATVSNSPGSQGLASASGSGSVTIVATLGSISGTASVSVTSGSLVSIAVSPQSPTIAVSMSQQFTATGTYSDGSTQNLTNQVTWTSDAPSVATISNSAGSMGLATSIGAGLATITASLGLSGSTLLTVTSSGSPQNWSLYGPSGRHSHSAVFDSNSLQMIIFGGQDASTGAGLNDLWLGKASISQSDSFTAESPSGVVPQGRFGHVATYDAAGNRMTVFGGSLGVSSCANDVWVLTGANGQNGTPSWTNVTPSGLAPSPRAYAGGVYDPNTNSMIVFGGSLCSSGYSNDVWVLSKANGQSGTPTWTQLNPSGPLPAARQSASAVYNSAHNTLIIYAGDAGKSGFGDAWVLSNANGTGGTPVWTQLAPSGTAPMPRTGHTAVFDSLDNRMTVFGGSAGAATLSDSWVLTSADGTGGAPAWVQITTQTTAPSVANHSAVYDQANNSMYVFGGASSQDKLNASNHVFTLSGANGISGGPKWVLGGPAVRYSHSAFYDPSTHAMFVFAGQHASTNLNFNDYWQASLAPGTLNLQWSVVSPKGTKPKSRFGHTGLYDTASNRMMVFGGATGFPAPCVNDYWVLQQANLQSGNATWVSVATTGTAPPVRTRHASVYDSATNTMIIFGGFDCNRTYYNDVWTLSNANDLATPSWTQLHPTGTQPPARESGSAVYDPATNSLIVYGGDIGRSTFGDIWILSHANGLGGTPAWTQLSPSNSGPVSRSGQTAIYDSTNRVMTIYGGYDGTKTLGDAWTLSNANGQGGPAMWNSLPPGQIRRFHTSQYDPNSNHMITYGGAAGTIPQVPSSDIYQLTDANGIP